VVRDEISSPEPVWWNLHMLARDIQGDGQTFHFPGQLDVDATVHFITPQVREVERREWGWRAVDSALLRNTKGDDYVRQFFGAYIPKDFQPGTWNGGEMAKWLRIRADAGLSKWLVVLMPNLRGTPAPKVERISDTSARISLGNETEVVHLGSNGQFQAAVERGGAVTTLLKPGEVRPWAEMDFRPAPPALDQGAR
jgi:hypothetical protein